jgi:methyl-accepting chemotaxis protein
MLKWFCETAPIRLKMSLAFGLQSSLTALAVGSILAMGLGAMTFPIAVGVGAAALLVSYLLGFVLKKAICDPYVTTVVRMEGLAAGDLTSPIAFTANADCVGRLTKAMFTFRDNAVAKIQADADALDADRRNEDSRRSAEEAAIEQQIALVSGSIGAGLEHLASGDLTFRLNDALPVAYEQLRGDFNAAIETLQQTMKTIAANVQGVSGSGQEISAAADDLSRRTEQQAASLEETAAALDEITATVRRTAEGAKEANLVVGAAKIDAEHSGQVVRQAVNAMTAIETSSKQVSQIVGVIDEIAFQTNLLALNAGVEAARAGDAGRGFAVVATEVRGLAQRSAEAAKEIKTLISASSQQVSSGVGLVGETGKALERIVSQVAQITTLVTEIAASAQEQSTGLAQVNTAINQMDQVTQQNAAMVEQSTAASHSLAQEAEKLAQLVARFKTGGDAQPVVRYAPSQKARPVPADAQRSASPRTQTMLKTTGHGGAAIKSSPAPADVSWEEF